MYHAMTTIFESAALNSTQRQKFRRLTVSSDQVIMTLIGREMIGLVTLVRDPSRATIVIARQVERGSGWERRTKT